MVTLEPFPDDIRAAIEAAAEMLRGARRVLAITGAGISAESGLPTYRGVGGLYEDSEGEDGIPIEVALSGEWFRTDPARTWKHLRQIEAACRGATPNAGHAVLARWQHRFDITVLTQNIDGFHRAAGSDDVIEMHGNFHHLYCTSCPWRLDVESYADIDRNLPCCPDCGDVIRPNVVLFGEMLPTTALDRYDRVMASTPDVVLSIGTTSVFPYIAAPVHWCRQWGGRSIEINPGRTDVSAAVDVRIPAPAAMALQAIDKRLNSTR